MINIFVYFFMMFFIFVFMFLFSLVIYMFNVAILVEWTLLEFNSINMEIIFLIDWISLLFMSFVLLISSMILIYSYIYMLGEKFIERFIILVLLFIFSMILMILSPNIFSIMFGWDGLGLVSYCLVIYYQNYMSYNSGMVTVMCNRVGDIGLLMIISLMLISGSWNYIMFNNIKEGGGSVIIILLILAAITKSAQIPFSSWLPMAMAAPTPVSALVHSSTLVTAGVYLMIRFNEYLMSSAQSEKLFFLAVLTMFMAGGMALFEVDLKKIIALSTLSQLGLMMMVLSMGLKFFAFFHLLTHAIFKSMLFMCSGIIIHSMMNNQDIRVLGGLNEFIPYTMMSFFIANLALCGFPFMAGFYSKDLIMEMIYCSKVSWFMLIFILLSLTLTVSYSVRLFYYMFFSSVKFYSYMSISENLLMNFSMMVLITLSIIVGGVLNWLMFFDFYLIYLEFEVKMITLMLCFLGIFSGIFMVVLNKLNLYLFSYFCSSMWFMNNMYSWIYSPWNFSATKFSEVDLSWVEFFKKFKVYYLMMYFNKDLVKYNMYMYMFMFIYFFSIMMMMY
uniref:NADH-ubiquinone oxidoreductase chain 5 n=1 Tax=Wasmannia auropunctata TaxID=64793 RepID=A0A191TFU3_WASAN|nr:NADH dehydrogenase subunit 5 [Wasmannia auropunctata]ANI87495.1 NADH dehydrogenase subunit 5 [Wasmannia auropunctata]